MQAVAIIDSLIKSADTLGPISEEKIKEAEIVIGIGFPPSYRRFLSKYGAALFKGFEIYGLTPPVEGDETPYWCNVIDSHKQMVKSSSGNIPLGYIPISDDGGDYNFYLDGTNQNPETGEYRVVVLGPGIDGNIIANNFTEFVLKRSKNEIRYKAL